MQGAEAAPTTFKEAKTPQAGKKPLLFASVLTSLSTTEFSKPQRRKGVFFDHKEEVTFFILDSDSFSFTLLLGHLWC